MNQFVYHLPISSFQLRLKDGAGAGPVNILLHKALSVPSFGRYFKRVIGTPFLLQDILHNQFLTNLNCKCSLQFNGAHILLPAIHNYRNITL